MLASGGWEGLGAPTWVARLAALWEAHLEAELLVCTGEPAARSTDTHWATGSRTASASSSAMVSAIFSALLAAGSPSKNKLTAAGIASEAAGCGVASGAGASTAADAGAGCGAGAASGWGAGVGAGAGTAAAAFEAPQPILYVLTESE